MGVHPHDCNQDLEAKISNKFTRNIVRSQKLRINVCKKTILGFAFAIYEVFGIECVNLWFFWKTYSWINMFLSLQSYCKFCRGIFPQNGVREGVRTPSAARVSKFGFYEKLYFSKQPNLDIAKFWRFEKIVIILALFLKRNTVAFFVGSNTTMVKSSTSLREKYCILGCQI